MLQHLYLLSQIIKPGVVLERNEVIRRCRSLANFSPALMRLLCMTQFFMLRRDENGQMSLI